MFISCHFGLRWPRRAKPTVPPMMLGDWSCCEPLAPIVRKHARPGATQTPPAPAAPCKRRRLDSGIPS
eukprot:12147727-Alexandrium_andersonii.AAC.1